MGKRKILLLGSTGQLGSELFMRYSRRADVQLTALSHADLDLTDTHALEAAFGALSPAVVINCVAYNLVDGAESDPLSALTLNSTALVPLARLCRNAGILLVHFSTDYVFDGASTHPYVEESCSSPLNVYGLSKHSGEVLLRLLHPRVCVVRTCGVYGRRRSPRGKMNFIDAILTQARSGKTPRVFDDLRCTPTSAVDLAGVVEALVDLEAVGTFHATNSGDCSWFELASATLTAVGIRCGVIPVRFVRAPGMAERPRFTVLSNFKLQSVLNRPMASWQDALARYTRHLEL